MTLVNAQGGLVMAEKSTADILMKLGWQEVKENADATPAEKPKTTTRKRTTTRRKTEEVENDADIKH